MNSRAIVSFSKISLFLGVSCDMQQTVDLMLLNEDTVT